MRDHDPLGDMFERVLGGDQGRQYSASIRSDGVDDPQVWVGGVAGAGVEDAVANPHGPSG